MKKFILPLVLLLIISLVALTVRSQSVSCIWERYDCQEVNLCEGQNRWNCDDPCVWDVDSGTCTGSDMQTECDWVRVRSKTSSFACSLRDVECEAGERYRGYVYSADESDTTRPVYGEYQTCDESSAKADFCNSDTTQVRCCSRRDDCVYSTMSDCSVAGSAYDLIGTEEADAFCVSFGELECGGYTTDTSCDGNSNCEWLGSCSLDPEYAERCYTLGPVACSNRAYCYWTGVQQACFPRLNACNSYRTQPACENRNYCDWGRACSLKSDVNTYGIWMDCDADEDKCSECDAATDLDNCDGVACYLEAGASGVGEYDSQGGGAQCCGDDADEYVITGNGFTRCCDNPDNCVDRDGVCRLGREICSNGIDDDCDGLIDEMECPAGEYLRSKVCEPGVCYTDPDECACCLYDDDCVHVVGVDDPCYRDADTALEWYNESKNTECQADSKADCGVTNTNCEWVESCDFSPTFVNDCDGRGQLGCNNRAYCMWDSDSGTCVLDPDACLFLKNRCQNIEAHCEWTEGCFLKAELVFDLQDIKASDYYEQVFEDVNTGLEGDEYCDPGTWHTELCEDTDGGINYAVKGTTVSVLGGSGTDYCTGDVLTEYYCYGGEVRSETHNCAPYLCMYGVCLTGPPCSSDADCEVGKFCEFPGCFVDTGGCVDVPADCSGEPTDYVCGCDVLTYDNDCLRKQAGVSKRHDGECCEDHGQYFTYRDCSEGVCDTDYYDWACCDNPVDCVYNYFTNPFCYKDADMAIEEYNESQIMECENTAEEVCGDNTNCAWLELCSLKSVRADQCSQVSNQYCKPGYYPYCKWDVDSEVCVPNPDACAGYTKSSTCTGGVFNIRYYCEWTEVCFLSPDFVVTLEDLKGSVHEEEVFEDINPSLEGDEYCDPGQWQSELFGCTDDDGGRVYFIQGTATSASGTGTDFCTGNILTEFYCDKNEVKSEDYDCSVVSERCENGACICPDNTYARWRQCAPGVCEEEFSDWACCDNQPDCVYDYLLNNVCYEDADEAARLLGNDTDDACQGDYLTSGSCDPDNCHLDTDNNDCRIKDAMTRDHVKNSDTYHDMVFLEINTELEGEEYCDPGTWFSESTSISGTVSNLRGDPLEGAKVTALSPGQPVYTEYTDDSGVYYLVVVGDLTYDVGASKTDYLPQTQSIFVVSGASETLDFALRYDSICDYDCSHIIEGVDDDTCHANCSDDPNGCEFYLGYLGAGSVCNLKRVGFITTYTPEPDKDIICCEGTPYPRLQATTSVNTTGNVVTIRKPVWYGGKLVNMIITFFD